jgi:hypothetical protein
MKAAEENIRALLRQRRRSCRRRRKFADWQVSWTLARPRWRQGWRYE